MESSQTILMVDDDSEEYLLLKDAFDVLKSSRSIHFEENSEQAIAFLRDCIDHNRLPRLIILDLNMPKLNGRQILKWIKEEPTLRDITVIIYSTSLNPMERDECLALGAYSYVIKPVSYKESLAIAEHFHALSNAT